MKAKSLKLRTYITLHALFKHSDERHLLNQNKLNEYLKPYGLECTYKSLTDTVKSLREYGVDVRHKGGWNTQGFWVEDRPLSEQQLDRLIFAVSTNSNISKEQATEILDYLKPFVTEFQEDKLVGIINKTPSNEQYEELLSSFKVINTAIKKGRRVLYKTDYLIYDREKKTVHQKRDAGTLFTPKCIYQTNNKFYMVGYNNIHKKVEAIDISEIKSIKISNKSTDPYKEKIKKILENIDPKENIPKEKENVLYRGEVHFHCKGGYVNELYKRFGPPSKPIHKNSQSRMDYTVSDAVITPKTLLWLSEIDDYSIRIKGPDTLLERVREYFKNSGEQITNPKISPARKSI